MPAADLGFAIQDSATLRVNMRSLRRDKEQNPPALFVVFGQGIQDVFMFLGALDRVFLWFVWGHGAAVAFTRDCSGTGRDACVDSAVCQAQWWICS